MPTIGASESFLQASKDARDVENLHDAESLNLDHQEVQIKFEISQRKNLLTPIVEASENVEALPVLNLSSAGNQLKQESICSIELPDDEDILEIMTQCSLLASEVIVISDDDDGPSGPPKSPVIKRSCKRRRAMRKSKTPGKAINAFIKHSSTPMSSIKNKPNFNSSLIAKIKNLSKRSIPTNIGSLINELGGIATTESNMSSNMRQPSSPEAELTLPETAPPPPPVAPLENTAQRNPRHQNQQSHNRSEQNINQFNNQFQMAVIDRSHPFGKIDRCNEKLVVNAIAECMLSEMNYNRYIAPRFITSFWRRGKFLFICADMATRQFLIETVAHLPQLWPGCSLAAVRNVGFRNTKRVRLLLGGQVLVCCANFMATLARQNPNLNVYEWELVNHSFWRCNDDYLLDFNIDSESYAEIRRNRGYVYFGFGRLLFNLDANRSMNTLSRLVKRMIRCNIRGQFNVRSQNNVAWL